ncbi:MAG: autotransporter domain-containing protein, partial [Gluconobacter cerinus]|uniref:autotransporter outer membrane beta-barrel domain-containing protein n=1 Tax=Gluconobacter cerinus TaxID=38307 RepID=UPI0039E7CCC2
ITGIVSADPRNNSNNIFLEDGSVFSSAVGFHLLAASGTTTVTGDSVIDNVVVNSGSSINFGIGGSTGIISGNILDNGVVDFNHSNDLTFSNAIEGSGVLVKDGSNNLTLSNSNTYTGGTVLNSGTLTGNSSSFGSGAITDNAALAIAQDTDGTLSNSISGTGTLTKAGSGNVTLTGSNTFAGGTLISDGTLTGGTSSFGSGAITDNAALAIAQDTDGTLSNSISGTGTLTKAGSGNVTLTGSNTFAGGTLISDGTLTGGTSSFGSGAITDNAALAIAQDTDGTLSNSISGTGTLTKAGSGNVTLAAYDTYTGDTTIENGTLTVSGFIGNSAVTVDDGATLSGTGTVGTTDIRSSGTLDTSANGLDSILHVNGNLTLEQGANYLAVVGENGHSSQTEVNGEVILNGNTLTVNTVGSPILSANSRYQILTASNGISGTFGTINDSGLVNNYYFLFPTIDYTADSIYLDMDRNSRSFASAAVTRNQYAVGSALDSMGAAGGAVTGAVELLNEKQARHAYNSLSGEIHASARTTMIENSFYIRNAALDRLVSSDCINGVSQSTIKTVSIGTAGNASACREPGLTMWGTAYGSWGHNGGGSNASSLHHELGGFVMGADTQAFQTWRIGGLVSYGHSAFSSNAVQSSGHSNDVSVGGYAGTHWGHLHLRLGAFYSWDVLGLNRTVKAPGLSDHLSSSYLGGTAQTFGDIAYQFRFGRATRIEPFANVAYVNVHTNGYHEDGGKTAALNGRGMDTGTTYSTFGVRGSTVFHVGNIVLMPNGSLGYRHSYGVIAPTAHQSFATGSSDFEAAGALLAQDAAVINAGTAVRLSDRLNANVSYVGQYGANYIDSGIRGKIIWNF